MGGQAEFAIGAIDFVFPSNVFEDAGMEDLYGLAFDGTNSFNIDLLTDANTVVAVSGLRAASQYRLGSLDRIGLIP